MLGALLAPIAGAAIGGLLGGGGGSGSQTASKEPWEPAAPWLKSLIGQGQDLSGYYQQNPFSYMQQAAYADLFNQSDYLNRAVPGLLSQFSQNQGFDRNNPTAKPQAMQFPTMPAPGVWGGSTPMAGLLGDMSVKQNPMRNGLMPAPAPVAAPAAPTGQTGFNWWDYGSAGA